MGVQTQTGSQAGSIRSGAAVLASRKAAAVSAVHTARTDIPTLFPSNPISKARYLALKGADNNDRQQRLNATKYTFFDRLLSPVALPKAQNADGLLKLFFKGTASMNEAELKYESISKRMQEGNEGVLSQVQALKETYEAYYEAANFFTRAGETELASYCTGKAEAVTKIHDNLKASDAYKAEKQSAKK